MFGPVSVRASLAQAQDTWFAEWYNATGGNQLTTRSVIIEIAFPEFVEPGF